MSLNVSIDDVPFAILEMVKARILAQRQKQQQAKPTAPKGPRPQFRRFGASSKAYRQPRPAALPDDGVTTLGHLIYSSTIESENRATLTLVNNRIYETQIGITQSLGWTVTSGDRLISFNHSITSPQPALPIGSISQNTSVALETRTATVSTATIRVYRAGTAANGYFEQDLGTIIDTYVSIPGSLSPAQYDDAISQLGGPFPTFAEQYDQIGSSAPPLPPGHISSNVYADEINRVTVNSDVTILGSYIYTTSWSNEALTAYSFAYGNGSFTIPVEGDTCILVVMSRYAHVYQKALFSGSFTTTSPVGNLTSVHVASSQLPPQNVSTISEFESVLNKAYICSTESVREVSIPAGLQSVLAILNPPMQYLGPVPVSGNPGSLVEPDIGLVSPFYSAWTPSVFAGMHQVYAFTDQSNLITFPSDLNPLITDTREGFFAGSESDKSHYYAEWIGDRDNIDLDQFQFYERQDDRTLELSSQADSSLQSLNICWDWDDPDYCRAMCAALGFTDDDLTP